jgi:hypothetical protein
VRVSHVQLCSFASVIFCIVQVDHFSGHVYVVSKT